MRICTHQVDYSHIAENKPGLQNNKAKRIQNNQWRFETGQSASGVKFTY